MFRETPDQLSLREKIGQMLLVGFQGAGAGRETREFIRDHNIGSVILFHRNIRGLADTVALTRGIHRLTTPPPLIFADQEGGTVVQFGELTSTLVSHRGLAQTGSPRYARKAGSIIGLEMDILGIDGVFAPVLDVNREEDNPVIGIRSFSAIPRVVKRYGAAFARGLTRKGVLACVKHFPGHGDTRVDSHHGLPVSYAHPDSLFTGPLVPFRHLIRRGIDGVMTAHIRFQKISGRIATFDPFLLGEVLRGRCRYWGVVFTDCLEMKAVRDRYSPGEIVERAVNAGVDVLVSSHCREYQEALLRALYDRVKAGKISEARILESVNRIWKMKRRRFGVFSSKGTDRSADLDRIRSPRSRRLERRIARRSIMIHRDQDARLPLDRRRSLLLLEWEKVLATQTPEQARSRFLLKDKCRQVLAPSARFGAFCLKLDGRIPPEVSRILGPWDSVICALYFRDPLNRRLQIQALQTLLQNRRDLVVITLGNPCTPGEAPGARTLISTFGFRQCQIDALFERLVK